jgi:hypothetical protein
LPANFGGAPHRHCRPHARGRGALKAGDVETFGKIDGRIISLCGTLEVGSPELI